LLQVAALVLSAPYLPSQLEAFHAKAAKVQHSLAVLVGASELHVVVSKLPWEEEDDLPDGQSNDGTVSLRAAAAAQQQQQQQHQQVMPAWQQVLLDGLGQAQLLEPGQLAAVEDAEAALLVQQRLFSSAVWNEAAQQLKAKHCLLPWLAVLAVVNGKQLRSLRGLVAAQGLHLAVEDLQQQQQQQQPEASPARSSRRRPKRSRKRTTITDDAAPDHPAKAAAAAEAAAEAAAMLASAGPVQEVLLVLSKQPLAAADIAVARQQVLATSSSSSSSSAAKPQPAYQPGTSLRLAGARSASSASSAVSVVTDSAEAREVLGARMHVSAQPDKPVQRLQLGIQRSHMLGTVYMLTAVSYASISRKQLPTVSYSIEL
jgi:hypothetical protein